MEELKNFAFFDSEPVASPHETLKRLEFTTATVGIIRSDSVKMIFGDAEGYVWCAERTPQLSVGPPLFFSAHTGPVAAMQQLATRNILVTAGGDGGEDVVKLWNMDCMPPDGGSPPCTNTIKLFTTKSPCPSPGRPLALNYNARLKLKLKGNPLDAPDARIVSPPVSVITLVRFTEDLSAMIVGLSSHELIFARGELEREKAPKTRRIVSHIAKARLLDAFVYKSGSLGMYFVYALHSDALVLHRCTLKGESVEETMLDAQIQPQCGAMTLDGMLVVGSADAISFYGGKTSLEECARNHWDMRIMQTGHFKAQYEKRTISFLREYVAVVACPDPDGRPDRFHLSLCERLGAYALRVFHTKEAQNVVAVLSDFEEVLLVCQDGKSAPDVDLKFTRIKEKEVQAKVDIVIRKEDFEVAVALSEKYDFDPSSRADIHRQFGDCLYDKSDHDGSILQYMKTIGSLEPSYVIRRFLDPQRIRQLSRYVEELHHEKHVGTATPDHTTLLLTCLSKLRLTDKLNKFLEKPSLRFDVDTAISVCMQAGYYCCRHLFL